MRRFGLGQTDGRCVNKSRPTAAIAPRPRPVWRMSRSPLSYILLELPTPAAVSLPVIPPSQCGVSSLSALRVISRAFVWLQLKLQETFLKLRPGPPAEAACPPGPGCGPGDVHRPPGPGGAACQWPGHPRGARLAGPGLGRPSWARGRPAGPLASKPAGASVRGARRPNCVARGRRGGPGLRGPRPHAQRDDATRHAPRPRT